MPTEANGNQKEWKMEDEKKKIGVGMSTQPSNGSTAAVGGGHASTSSDVRYVASDELNKTNKAMDKDNERNKRKRAKPKHDRVREKAYGRYRAALKILDRQRGKKNLSQQEVKDAEWAKRIVEDKTALSEEERLKCRNALVETDERAKADKRQRSLEELESNKKRRIGGIPAASSSMVSIPTTSKARVNPTTSRAVSEVLKDAELHVALIDRNSAGGIISPERWNQVEMKLVDRMVELSMQQPKQRLPIFEGAGWLNDCKMLKCTDHFTKSWIEQEIFLMKADDLWDGASLAIVTKDNMPRVPKAKVFIPRVVPAQSALALLRGQNPDIPTEGWRVLHVGKPEDNGKGQFYILQIDEESERILFDRAGKMAWGCGNVYLRLRNPNRESTQGKNVVELESDADSLFDGAGLGRIQIGTDVETDPEISDIEIEQTVIQPTLDEKVNECDAVQGAAGLSHGVTEGQTNKYTSQ